MNRAQRRAYQQGGLYTVDHLREILKQDRKEVLNKLANDYSAVVALCLRDKLGFGHKRAARFLRSVSTMFNDLQDGHLTIEDIKATLAEEIKVIIE
jgi:hypothetical protein